MNKTWFSRTLLSYIPAFFIVTALLFLIFLQVLSTHNRNNAVKSHAFLAQQALQFIDSSLKSIDEKITLEVMSNPELSRYFDQADNTDLYLNVRVMSEMQRLMLANPLIDSIYTVRFKDKSVLGAGATYSLDQFADAAFIKRNESSPNSRWSDARKYRELSGNENRVVSLTRGFPIFSQNKGMIVVNVKTDTLREQVRQMYDPSVSFIHVFDKQNIGLFAGNGAGLEERSGDNSKVFAEYASDYTGWTIQTGMLQAGMMRFIFNLFNVWFVFGIATIVGGTVWIVYVTKRNYKPIESIVSRIQGYSRHKAGEAGFNHRNEFLFIESALEKLIEETTYFEQQYEKDLNVKRNFLFYEMLEGTREISLAEWQQEMGGHRQPGAAFGLHIAFVLEIDQFAEFAKRFNKRDQNLLKFALGCVVQETAGNNGGVVKTLWTSSGQLSGMLGLDEPERDADRLFAAILESIVHWVERNMQMTVTIGAGEPVDSPGTMNESYKEALECLRYKTHFGINRVIRYSEIAPSKGEMYEQLQFVSSFVHAYRYLDDEWRTIFGEMMAQMRVNMLSRDETIHFMNFFLFHLSRAVSGMGDEFQAVWKNDIAPNLQDALDSFETKEELEGLFKQTLELFAGRIGEMRQSRSSHQLVEDMKAYIEANFTDPNLSLDSLGERFGVSGKNLSKWFKELFGVKFVDFLIDLRMRHAKRLLTETDESVQDISAAVGYSSPISFIRAFKKTTGFSPGDFRKEEKH